MALRALVLVAGMTTMAKEMSASRLLAPFFGASQMVWANVIGLILIYLSVGYWYGGRVADRHPTMRGLCTVCVFAAACIAAVAFVAHPVLSLAAGSIDRIQVGVVIGSFAGSLLLFSVPVTLLGMVPPYAVRLALHDVDSSGEVSGKLYALSTIGSILGTFGSALVLIEWIGTRRTMLAFALVLAAIGVGPLVRAGNARRWRFAAGAVVLAIALSILLPVGQVKANVNGRVLYEAESPYQFVQVVEQPDGTRLLQLNEGWAIHSRWSPRDPFTHDVWDRYLVFPAFTAAGAGGRDASNASYDMLILGNAAGTTSNLYAMFRPFVRIDGVELDPTVSQVGRRFFHMSHPQLHVHDADARVYLQDAGSQRWDVIFVDAYRQPYIPFYLTTKEFFTLVRQHLRPGGVLAINVGSPPDDHRIQRAVGATMRAVFPSVYSFQAEPFNQVLVATPRPTTAAELSRDALTSHLAGESDLRQQFVDFAHGLHPMPPDPSAVLTDDHAPVEWMTDREIVRYAAGQ